MMNNDLISGLCSIAGVILIGMTSCCALVYLRSIAKSQKQIADAEKMRVKFRLDT